jgi:hypothetical protein
LTKSSSKATKTQRIDVLDESSESKVKYGPCATIAYEEIEEFPDKYADELKDCVKKFDDDLATFRVGIQKSSKPPA